MLTIGYLETVGFVVADSPPMETDVQLDGLAVGRFAADKLREALGVPGLSAEQVEVARLEGELDAAKADGRIAAWRPYTGERGYTVTDGCGYVWNTGCLYPRLEQARRAAEHVRALQAPAPKPRDVGEMSDEECRMELRARGWSNVGGSDWVGYVRDGIAVEVPPLVRTGAAALRDAVRTARELDGEG